MTTTRTWYHRLSQWWNPNGVPKPPEIVTLGIFEHAGFLRLCQPSDDLPKGHVVKIIMVSRDFEARYCRNLNEYNLLQRELRHMPKWFRPRRKPAAKVEIPDV